MNSASQVAPKKRMSKAKRRRIATWSFLAVIGLSMLIPLGSYTIHWLGSAAVAQEAGSASNPRSNFWRAVREGKDGYSAVKGEGAASLVQSGGNNWRAMRNGPVMKYLPWLLGGMVVLLLLYHILHGKNKLDHAPSGKKVKRWNGFERLVHWFVAITFIILAITGLSMLFGKSVLIPLLGKAGFAGWAGLSIKVHNVVGPAFSVGIALMIVMWIWHNFPTATDFKWLAQGGGMFGKAHPSAGRMNAGEKIWFWILMTIGVAVCVTGIVMVAPMYGWTLPIPMEGRALMQESNLIHAIAGVIWTTVALGHIYIGTAGTEGAFEGMSTGYVSEEWAKQHHDLWFEDLEKQGESTGGYLSRADLEILRRENAAKEIAGTS